MGTAEQYVLARLTAGLRPLLSWSRSDGTSIYENREFTERLCMALTARGYVDETFESHATRYTVNQAGMRAAEGLSVPGPRGRR